MEKSTVNPVIVNEILQAIYEGCGDKIKEKKMNEKRASWNRNIPEIEQWATGQGYEYEPFLLNEQFKKEFNKIFTREPLLHEGQPVGQMPDCHILRQAGRAIWVFLHGDRYSVEEARAGGAQIEDYNPIFMLYAESEPEAERFFQVIQDGRITASYAKKLRLELREGWWGSTDPTIAEDADKNIIIRHFRR